MNQFPGFLLLIAFFTIGKISAQNVLPLPSNYLKSYQNKQRDSRGAPGEKYWQNKADYTIKINFDPVSRKLAGTVAIDYLNNSPDTLTRIVFKLYPNIYQKEAVRAVPVGAEDLTDGVSISSFSVDGKTLDVKQYTIRGTNMVVRNGKVLPQQKLHFEIAYSFEVNKGSFIRGGQIDPGAFFIPYFFPRITVYDDIDGWNEYPYTGQYEFYNDYGNFEVDITVPADYQVWATGDLKNAGEVFSEKILTRIARAVQSDETVNIITIDDIADNSRQVGNQPKTWKFKADNVTDFAFGISNHYVWQGAGVTSDAKTGRRTRVDAVYDPSHKAYEPVLKYARKTVAGISTEFPGVPFPFSHETIFDGPSEMEYPMMVVNFPMEKQQEAIEITAHEIFHSIFPFYVGINETKYSFMDEGFATMAEFVFHPLVDSTVKLAYDISDVNAVAGSEQEFPLMTLTPYLSGRGRYVAKNLKPALGYLYVREMLGEAVFNKSLQSFIGNWKGKHPSPFDFFNSINSASGTDLNWFWKNWFFEKGIPDLAITNVLVTSKKHIITVTKAGDLAVPVHLTIYYQDGSQVKIGSDISCWREGNKIVRFPVVSAKKIKKIVLGDAFDADSRPENNSWTPPVTLSAGR